MNLGWLNPLPALKGGLATVKGFVGKHGVLDQWALPKLAAGAKGLGGVALNSWGTFFRAWGTGLSKVYGFALPKAATVGGFLGSTLQPLLPTIGGLGGIGGKALGLAGNLGWKVLGGIAAAGLGALWLLNKVTGAPRAIQRRVVRVTGIGGGRGRHSMTTIMESSIGGSSGHGVGKFALIGLLLFGWWAAPAALPQPGGPGELMHGYHVRPISSACSTPLAIPAGGATGIVATLGAKIHNFSFKPPSPAADLEKAHGLITRLGRLWRTFTDAKTHGIIPMDGAATAAQAAAAQAAAVPAAACCPAGAPLEPAGGISASLTAGVIGPSTNGLTLEQTNNAQTIVAVGAGIGVPAAAEIIAVAVAMQESSLTNLPGGDLDSAGLFQQRPSQGWGSYAQVTDPVFASTTFYTRLLAVPGWQQMPLTVAAQAVQRSGSPDAYARWQGLATQLVAGANGTAPQVGAAAFVPVCSAPSVPINAPTSPSGQTAIAFAMSQIGKPYLFGGNGPGSWDCSGLVDKAFALPGRPTTFTLINMGTQVAPGQEQPGDLVFPDAGHVGISLGGGQMVDAPHTGAFVRVEPTGALWAVRRLTAGTTPA